MTDDMPRTWDQLRADAHKAVLDAGRAGPNDMVAGLALVLADAVLAVCEEETINRMTDVLVQETRIKGMDFRRGAKMDVQPAQALVAHWVRAAQACLDDMDAPNYIEIKFTEVSAMVGLAGETERYAFILQRVGPGKLTPHEARLQAERERDDARAELAALKSAAADAS